MKPPKVKTQETPQMCRKCGKNPCYQRDGRTFALCATCGLKNLITLVNELEPEKP